MDAWGRHLWQLSVGRRPLGGGGGAGVVGVLGPAESPPPGSNHTITINLTLTFAATWFGHASHFDWAEHHPPGLGLGVGLGVG